MSVAPPSYHRYLHHLHQGIGEYGFTAMVALLSLLVLVIFASAHLSSEDHSSILITSSILMLIDTAILPVTTVVSSYNSTEHVEYSHWLATYHHHYTIHAIWIIATSLLLSITTCIPRCHHIISSYCRYSSSSISVAYLVVFLFGLMSVTTWIAAQHFSLAMLVAFTTVPTAIVLYSITLQTDEESNKAGLPPSVVLQVDPIIVVGPEHSIDEDHDDATDLSQRRRKTPSMQPPRIRYYSALLAVSMVRAEYRNCCIYIFLLSLFLSSYVCDSFYLSSDHHRHHAQSPWIDNCRFNSLKHLLSKVRAHGNHPLHPQHIIHLSSKGSSNKMNDDDDNSVDQTVDTDGTLLEILFDNWIAVGSMAYPCLQLLHTITSLTALRLASISLLVSIQRP